jgi:hypothetical protein
MDSADSAFASAPRQRCRKIPPAQRILTPGVDSGFASPSACLMQQELGSEESWLQQHRLAARSMGQQPQSESTATAEVESEE